MRVILFGYSKGMRRNGILSQRGTAELLRQLFSAYTILCSAVLKAGSALNRDTVAKISSLGPISVA